MVTAVIMVWAVVTQRLSVGGTVIMAMVMVMVTAVIMMWAVVTQ